MFLPAWFLAARARRPRSREQATSFAHVILRVTASLPARPIVEELPSLNVDVRMARSLVVQPLVE